MFETVYIQFQHHKGYYWQFIFRYVSDKLGGPVDRGQVANFSWQLPLSQLKFDLKSNVVPLGKIKAGIHYHRALLFKVKLL